MAVANGKMSLTRPGEPEKEGATSPWQFPVGLLVAITGLLAVTVLFVISAVVAGWVSDVTNSSETNPANLLARVASYKSWMAPVAMASVGLIMTGIAVILHGVVRRLWIQMAVMKEGLVAMKGGGATSEEAGNGN